MVLTMTVMKLKPYRGRVQQRVIPIGCLAYGGGPMNQLPYREEWRCWSGVTSIPIRSMHKCAQVVVSELYIVRVGIGTELLSRLWRAICLAYGMTMATDV